MTQTNRVYRVNDRVESNINNYEKEVFKNDAGTISKVTETENGIVLTVQFEHCTATYTAAEFRELRRVNTMNTYIVMGYNVLTEQKVECMVETISPQAALYKIWAKQGCFRNENAYRRYVSEHPTTARIIECREREMDDNDDNAFVHFATVEARSHTVVKSSFTMQGKE